MILSRTPSLGQLRPVRPRSSYRSPLLGQSFDGTIGVSHIVGDALRLAVHGLTAYLGIHVGMKESGWLSIVGWVVGIGQGMGAFIDVLTMAANIQEARRQAHEPEPQDFRAFEVSN